MLFKNWDSVRKRDGKNEWVPGNACHTGSVRHAEYEDEWHSPLLPWDIFPARGDRHKITSHRMIYISLEECEAEKRGSR